MAATEDARPAAQIRACVAFSPSVGINSNNCMEPKLTGILNLDKPPGISSARAVDRVKRLLPRGTKIGHAGTLDPFATGVLLLLVGKATKACERLMDTPKQYETTVRFGATTETDDPESPPQPWNARSGGA